MARSANQLGMTSIDVTMTATRRPDLVTRTLASFSKQLFARLPIRTLFVNIDPLWGDPDDDRAIESACRTYAQDVKIRCPATPSYGAAVKWLWGQPTTDWFLHLEDDWVLSHKISLRRLGVQMGEPDVAQIKIANWTRLRRRRKPPELGLCPLFVRRDFALKASTLMNLDLDPDKQFRNGANPELSALSQSSRAVYFGGPFTRETAMDIGREWRDERNISKSIVDGVSVWSSNK